MPALTKNQKIEQLEKQVEKLKESEDYLKNLLQINVEELKKNIEPLEQNKVYFVKVKDYEELKRMKEHLQGVKSQMYWNMPQIIISTQEINNIGEAKELMNKEENK